MYELLYVSLNTWPNWLGQWWVLHVRLCLAEVISDYACALWKRNCRPLHVCTGARFGRKIKLNFIPDLVPFSSWFPTIYRYRDFCSILPKLNDAWYVSGRYQLVTLQHISIEWTAAIIPNMYAGSKLAMIVQDEHKLIYLIKLTTKTRCRWACSRLCQMLLLCG